MITQWFNNEAVDWNLTYTENNRKDIIWKWWTVGHSKLTVFWGQGKWNDLYFKPARAKSCLYLAKCWQECQILLTKGHSSSLWPQKNVRNFSLEWPTIFLPPPFSYNYLSRSFLCMLNLNSLLHYWVKHNHVLTLWH